VHPEAKTRGPTLALLFVLAVLAAPVEYLTHEGAHYLAARALGAHATLHFDRVTLGGSAQLGPLQYLVFAAAGPAMDWVVGLTALAMLVRRYTHMRLVLGIWVARPMQFLPAATGIDLSAFGIFGGLGGSDEGAVAAAVGLTPAVLIWLEMALAAPLLGLAVACIPRAGRVPALLISCIGVLAGWAGWLALGPRLLP
jgi:hypothetical protein